LSYRRVRALLSVIKGFLVFVSRNLEEKEKCIKKFKGIFFIATNRLKDDEEHPLLLLFYLCPTKKKREKND
jgi:hypothetical protein